MSAAVMTSCSAQVRPVAPSIAQRVTLPKPFLGGSKAAFLKPTVAAVRAQRHQSEQLQISALAPGQTAVDIEKPTGLTLGASKSPAGGLTVKSASGNAAKAGIKAGDTIIYTSSFFGEELWPADQLGFTRSALNAAPSPVAVIYVKGENTQYNVKRLPKLPAPKRFGRKLTETEKARATHICLDCGFIYSAPKPFAELGDYQCPQCSAPKKRFAPYDVVTGRAVKGGNSMATSTIATVVGGLVGLGVLLYVGLNV